MLRRLSLLLSIFLLAACGQAPDPAANQPAVAIESGDECHLCGMIIEEQPGPKGQLYLRSDTAARKFCSVAEMFTFLLQPEYSERIGAAYVHDVAAGSWQTPDDQAFVPAREAFYVLGHNQPGGMGHALASFRQRQDAEAFVQNHGGRVLTFDQIDLAALSTAQPDAGAGHGAAAGGHSHAGGAGH